MRLVNGQWVPDQIGPYDYNQEAQTGGMNYNQMMQSPGSNSEELRKQRERLAQLEMYQMSGYKPHLQPGAPNQTFYGGSGSGSGIQNVRNPGNFAGPSTMPWTRERNPGNLSGPSTLGNTPQGTPNVIPNAGPTVYPWENAPNTIPNAGPTLTPEHQPTPVNDFYTRGQRSKRPSYLSF